MGCIIMLLAGFIYTTGKVVDIIHRRGLWVLKNTRKSVVRDLDIRSCKQLKIRQETVKMES